VFRHLRTELDIEITRQPRTLPYVPTQDEIRRYYQTVWQARRTGDVVLIKTLLYTGVRVAELVALRLDDVDLDANRIRVNLGKGGKDRLVPFPDATPPASTSALGWAGHGRVRVVDRLVDRLDTQAAGRLVGEPSLQLVGDLLRTPPLAQQVHHHRPQLGIDHHAPRTRPRDPFGRGPVRTAGQITAMNIGVASKLPAARGRGTTQLTRDLAHRALLPPQVGDHHPLVQRQVPGMPLRRRRDVHGRIVHRLTRRVTDRAPESPPCPGPAIDPDQATRLPIAHPVRDQPNEPVLLLRQRTTRMRRSRPSHRNLRLPSSNATFTGICPATLGPVRVDTLNRSCADVTERLFHMFEAVHPLPVITAVVRQCRTDLDVPSGAIPELLERLASQRLSDLQPAP